MTTQTTKEEWLDGRRIGSSDAPVIMGVSPWTTPYKLWEKKVFHKETPDNFAMAHGREMEPLALRWFENKMGVKLVKERQDLCFVHGDKYWMTATLDGMEENKKFLVEVKCPKNLDRDHAEVRETGQVPEHYWPQLQHQLEVTGIDRGFYLSFDGLDGILVEVERDKDYIKKLVKGEEMFWQWVVDLIPPPLGLRDKKCREGDKSWEKLCQEGKEIAWNLEYYEDLYKKFREKIIKEADGESCYGHGVEVRHETVSGRIDYSAIPCLAGLDLNAYRKPPTQRWVVTCKE